MSFVNALAHIANIEDHHPDLEVGYNYCRVRYTTHAIGGLSENDFICAAKIDQLPLNSLMGARSPRPLRSPHRQPGQLAIEAHRTTRQHPAADALGSLPPAPQAREPPRTPRAEERIECAHAPAHQRVMRQALLLVPAQRARGTRDLRASRRPWRWHRTAPPHRAARDSRPGPPADASGWAASPISARVRRTNRCAVARRSAMASAFTLRVVRAQDASEAVVEPAGELRGRQTHQFARQPIVGRPYDRHAAVEQRQQRQWSGAEKSLPGRVLVRPRGATVATIADWR